MRGNGGRSSTVIVLALAVALTLSSSLSILSLNQAAELIGIEMNLDEGLEIIRNRSYKICSNIRWDEMKTAGIKLTEQSWKGFLQICERLTLDFGNLQIYVDLEARVMWVYSDPSSEEADIEAYYVQFA